MYLDGKIYPFLIEKKIRLKPAIVRTSKGNVTTLSELKCIIRSDFKIRNENEFSSLTL